MSAAGRSLSGTSNPSTRGSIPRQRTNTEDQDLKTAWRKMRDLTKTMAEETDDPETDWQDARASAVTALIAIARDQELDDNALIRWALLTSYVSWTNFRNTVDFTPFSERVSYWHGGGK